MQSFFQIQLEARQPYALVNADFSVVECLLQDDPHWGALVVRLHQLSAEPALPMPWAAGLLPSKIIPDDQNRFTALGLSLIHI